MSFSFAPATKGKTSIFLGLSGPAGSGKTLSALRIAKGLGGKIAVIDTENKRALHYADKFDFIHADFQPPYTPARYIEAVEAAIKAGGDVIIIDSASHEWEGTGGILDMQVAEFERMGNKDAMKFTSWIKPKAENNKFVNRLLQLNKHFILCFRAKEGMELTKNDKGKIEPVKLGWVPICGDRLDYEMTALLVLPPGKNGRPDMKALARKMPFYLSKTFADGEQLTEETGKALAEWAGSTPGKVSKTEITEVAQVREAEKIVEPEQSPAAGGSTTAQAAGEEGAAPAETAAPPPASRALDDPPAATTVALPPVPRGVDPDVWQQACAFAVDGKDELTKFINTVDAPTWETLRANLSPLKELFPKGSS